MSGSGEERAEAKRKARHDIKNQLTSITLALEQLKHELRDEKEDCTLYFDMIASSCKSINNLLGNL